MQPSIYQSNILDWLVSGAGNACCNAVAGSGKSTVLKMGALKLLEFGCKPSDVKIIVFGKANSLDLIEKFGSQWKESISTLHSAGWTLIKEHLQLSGNVRNLIKSGKYKFIAQDQGFINKRGAKGTLKGEGAIDKEADFTKLLDLVRLTSVQPTRESVVDICEHFEIAGVWKPETIATAIAQVLKIGENMAAVGESFDFTDQIWLPVKWKLSPRTPYKFVLCDEAQDLNAAQLELCLLLAGSEGRLLFVADPKQAIMGFAGADNRSYDKIIERTKAAVLPLSVCYRCPTEHINLVKRIFPEATIECAPNAIAGSIIQCAEKDLDTLLKVGDMVISRKTAPLVSLCIKLIAKGIKATVKGRDIGEAIKKDLEAISEAPGFIYEKFNEAVNQYRASLFARYESLDNEEQLKESLNDKLEALSTIYRSQTNAKSVEDLGIYIDSLFSDDTSPITLSTCHRAKGLEGERIFLHRAEDMPMTWRSQLDWQFEQEMNLLYVALTRSQNELFIVGNPDWLKLDDEPVEAEDTTVETTIQVTVIEKTPSEELDQEIREYFKEQGLAEAKISEACGGVIKVATGTMGTQDIESRAELFFSPKHRPIVKKFAQRYCKLHEPIIEKQTISDLEIDELLAEGKKVTTENIYSETEIMEVVTADVYADSTECNIEYVAGQEQHSSSWAKFWVRGLDKWAVRENDGIPDSDHHSVYHQFVCLDVPDNQVFTIFEQDGDKRGTDGYKFLICKTSREITRIESSYTDKRFIAGNFESICQGIGKTKAPRLFDWWISYVGDKDGNNRTNEEKLAFANHCLNHINKRGIKALPAIEIPQSTIVDDPLELDTKPLTPTELKQWVDISSIVLDAGTQSRQQTNQVTIDDYQRQMIDDQWNWEFEPLPILFTDSDNYYPGDGHHRILAAMQVRNDIFAEVRSGTLRDAIFYSCQANRFHGLQRSRADKRNQVELILKDLEWQVMSDRAIAEHCGVSAPFVGNIRAELVGSGTVNISSERTDKKGRRIATGNIGKKSRTALVEEAAFELAGQDVPTDLPEIIEITQQELSEGFAPTLAELVEQKTTVELTPGINATVDFLCNEVGAVSLAILIINRLSPDEKKEIYRNLI